MLLLFLYSPLERGIKENTFLIVLFKALLEIGNNIINVFNAYRKTQQAVANTKRVADFGGDISMGLDSWKSNQRFDAAQALGKLN